MERWGALCHNRQTRKTGDRSLTSTWAMFRHRFALQVHEQCDPNFPDDKRTEGWFRIHRDGILFVDEHHEKCNMGKANTSKKEWLCAVHKDDDTQFVPLFLDDGITKNPDARFLKCNPRPKAKYESVSTWSRTLRGEWKAKKWSRMTTPAASLPAARDASTSAVQSSCTFKTQTHGRIKRATGRKGAV